MTRELTVSTPGKLYLFGEYGVLAGGWSVVAGVDRRVTARRKERATGYQVRGADFDDASLVEAVLEVLGDEARADSAGYFESNVGAFYERGRKLGLGSSAASAVALTAAASLEGRDAGTDAVISARRRAAVFEAAEEAHRRFQGGRGSGGGLAAATWGGVLGYRVRRPRAPFSELMGVTEFDGEREVGPAVVKPVRLPDDLQLRAVWIGEPASTTSFIARVERKLSREPERVLGVLDGIAEVAQTALEVCADPSDVDGEPAEALLASFRRGDRAMEELGEVVEAPIVVDRHRRLREVAEQVGAAAKPSGAGGGDYSILAGTDRTDWERLEAELPGWAQWAELEFAAPGLRSE